MILDTRKKKTDQRKQPVILLTLSYLSVGKWKVPQFHASVAYTGYNVSAYIFLALLCDSEVYTGVPWIAVGYVLMNLSAPLMHLSFQFFKVLQISYTDPDLPPVEALICCVITLTNASKLKFLV